MFKFSWKNPKPTLMQSDKKKVEFDFEVTHFTAREIFQRVWPMVRPHIARLSVAASLVMFVGVAVAIGPMPMKYIIDEALPNSNMPLVLLIAGIFLASQITRMGLWYIAQKIVLWTKELLLYQLRSDGFGHLQRLCLRFHNKYPSGFLYDRVFGNSINTLGGFLQICFQQMTVQITGLIFSLTVCFYWSWELTCVILVGASGYVFIARTMSPRIYVKSLAFINEANRIAQYIVDKLRGTKTIQALAMEGRMQDDFEARVWPMQLKALDAQFETMKLGFVTEGMGYIITSVLMVLGSWTVFHWNVKPGVLVAFMGYQGMLIGFVSSLLGVYGQFMSARAGFDQLFTVLGTQPTVVETPGGLMHKPVIGELEFKDVTFAYDTKVVIRNMSFTIKPGQMVALVGRSGGGKTTISNLMLRFYDPQEGGIFLDGHNIKTLPLREYRALYGVVLQDPFLFDDTIEMNLRCASPLASEEELWAALDRAQAGFVREFPNKLQHRCGEGGGQLSGGQRQRLAIARCMLLQPKFLILDEATSALDNETESYIQKALENLFENRTAFIIAHRLSTIRQADRVLVFDEGQLVEQGTFKELMAAKGLFHRLHNIATSSSSEDLKIEEAGFA